MTYFLFSLSVYNKSKKKQRHIEKNTHTQNADKTEKKGILDYMQHVMKRIER